MKLKKKIKKKPKKREKNNKIKIEKETLNYKNFQNSLQNILFNQNNTNRTFYFPKIKENELQNKIHFKILFKLLFKIHFKFKIKNV